MISLQFLTQSFFSMRVLEKMKITKGTRVLLRVDYNTPLRGGFVSDGWKIERSLETIKYLLGKGARVIIISHLGRPEGKIKKELSLASICDYLERVLGTPVKFLNIPLGDAELKREISSMPSASAVMLENLRFYPGEEKNDSVFAGDLASLGEVFVNDAFGTSHRKSVSIIGLPKYLPSCAGLLLQQEVKLLGRLLKKPAKPFVVMMGGAKISDKISVIKNLARGADKILLGGAMANNIFAAKGYGIGKSLSSPEDLILAKKLAKEKKIMLPVDVVIGERGKEKSARVVDISTKPHQIVKGKFMILDVGPKTVHLYSNEIKKAKTIVWNGPMGYFEEPQFSHGTIALGRMVAAHSKGPAFGVIGGGETAQALRRTKMDDMADWISTGGGAMLEFLEGKTLPGIKALS